MYMRPSLLKLRSIFQYFFVASYVRAACALPRRTWERSAPPIVKATAHRVRAMNLRLPKEGYRTPSCARNIITGRSLVARANGGLSDHVTL